MDKNVRLSDHRLDLAWTRLIVRADDLPDRGETALGLYAQFGNKPIRDLAYFEVIACTTLITSVLLSLRYGAERQGLRPEAAAMMRRSEAHTRYAAALLHRRTGIAMPDVEEALIG